MPIRTTSAEVKAIIETSLVDPNLDPFIQSASLLVDEHLSTHTPAISTNLLKEIETYLAAHFITLYEPRVSQEDADGISFRYEGAAKGEGFSSSRYGQMAMVLDPTGKLTTLDKAERQAFVFRVGNERDVEG